MSIIKPLTPKVCPNCGGEDSLYTAMGGILSCRLCGYQDETTRLSEEPVTVQVTTADPRDSRDFIPSTLSSLSQVSPWVRTIYNSAIHHVHQKEWNEAIKDFRRVVQNDRDMLDAHLWLARLELDAETKRKHLSEVLANRPNHAEAMLELMVLDGKISREEADRVKDPSNEIERLQATTPVGTATTVLSCPVCGGGLTTDEAKKEVYCAFCGHIETLDESAGDGGESFTMALLQKRAKGVEWVIGERLLHCNNCGADQTLPDGKMSSFCIFCGSNHVIEQDALNSFRQPDGVVPFTITDQQAQDAIREQLDSKKERFKGFFVNNKIKRAAMKGVYLPFWVFDMVLEATLTYERRQDDSNRVSVGMLQDRIRRTKITEMANNLPILGVLSPKPTLVNKISAMDLRQAKPYDPKILAKYPAELPAIDFDKASLEARARARLDVQHKHEGLSTLFDSEKLTGVSIMVQQMSFRLLLLPMWIATLLEEDGDVRLGLVNGQTGEATLAKAQKPPKR